MSDSLWRTRQQRSCAASHMRPTRNRFGIFGGVAMLATTLLAVNVSGSEASAANIAKPQFNRSANVQSCSKRATQLTFWSWVPGIQRSVNLFNKTHNGICVQLDNVGAGSTELEKLAAALKAGSGAPDVVQLPGIEASQFFNPSELTNLATLGANSVKKGFYPFAWARLETGGATYCIPQDIGPMAMLYNTTFFKKYGISVPTTWTQFASDAAKVHRENPQAALTDFPTNDPNWTFGLLSQRGANQFGPLKGSTLPIHIDNAPAKAFAAYWQPMISKGIVQSVPDFNSGFYRELGDGTLGVWLTAAWGPDDFSPSLAGPSVGKWRVAPLPQWKAGANVSADWGGSCDAVPKQSSNPKAAAAFDIWLNTNEGSWKLMATSPTDLYPSLPRFANASFFVKNTIPLTGNQQINRVFAKAAANLSPDQLGSPIEGYVFTEYTDDASSGHPSLQAVLSKLQSQAVSYAQQEGIKVVS